MDSGKGKGGILAVILLILGALALLKGPETGIIATILHLAGIASLVIGIGIFAIVALAIIAAMSSKKKNPNAQDKVEISQFLEEKRSELAKYKSTVATTQLEIRKLEEKIDDTDRKIKYAENDAKAFVAKGDDESAKRELIKIKELESTKERFVMIRDGYRNALNEMQRVADILEADILSFETRLKNADAMMSSNDGREQLIKEYEEKAQYEADYQEALKELETGISADLVAKYGDSPSVEPDVDTSGIDEQLRRLKNEQGTK